MTTHTEHTEDTRERILRTAASLFRRHGFNGASMQDVADEVGVTKSTLYHHFSSKQALLTEILQQTVDRVTPAVRQVATAPIPATERLRRAVRLHVVELIRDRDNLACFIEEGRHLPAEPMRGYLAKRDEYEWHFRRIIRLGVDREEFAECDERIAAMAILGMCNSITHWYRPEGSLAPDDIADMFADLAVRAVGGGVEERRSDARST